MGVWSETIKKELNEIFDGHKNRYIEENEFIISFSCQSVRIAGQEVIYPSMTILIKTIESKWQVYKPELLLDENVRYPTIFVSARNTGVANSLTKDAIVINNFSEAEVIELTRELFTKIFPDKINHYRSLENCNSVINKDIEIKDGIGSITSLEGLPFRKVLLAEAVGDPRSNEIKEAMRTYCEENYELGRNNNFEQLCRLKQVFEKMFPSS